MGRAVEGLPVEAVVVGVESAVGAAVPVVVGVERATGAAEALVVFFFRGAIFKIFAGGIGVLVLKELLGSRKGIRVGR